MENKYFRQYNANPLNNRVGDCTVRAIATALNQDWDTTYIGMCLEGFLMADMPSANNVWGAYLKKKGFKRHHIPDDVHLDYTVIDFCKDNPHGTFVLALASHVVCVIDGYYYDFWKSGNEEPIYYWCKD